MHSFHVFLISNLTKCRWLAHQNWMHSPHVMSLLWKLILTKFSKQHLRQSNWTACSAFVQYLSTFSLFSALDSTGPHTAIQRQYINPGLSTRLTWQYIHSFSITLNTSSTISQQQYFSPVYRTTHLNLIPFYERRPELISINSWISHCRLAKIKKCMINIQDWNYPF